jgi:hypothetical protein
MTSQDEHSILTATRNNDCFSIKNFLNKGVSPDTSNSFGLTSLHIAASTGNVEIIDILMEYNANSNVSCIDGWTPLCEAAKYNQPLAFEHLLHYGANIEFSKKWSVYDAALRANADIKIFKILLEKIIQHGVPNDEIIQIINKSIQNNRDDVLKIIILFCPDFSDYLNSEKKKEQEPEDIITFFEKVLIDTKESDEVLEVFLLNGYRSEKLSNGGPCVITEEFIEILHDSKVIFKCKIPSKRINFMQPFLAIRKEMWLSGYYPRIAACNPQIEITGLSLESGGWIDKKAYKYLYNCPSYKWIFIENKDIVKEKLKFSTARAIHQILKGEYSL